MSGEEDLKAIGTPYAPSLGGSAYVDGEAHHLQDSTGFKELLQYFGSDSKASRLLATLALRCHDDATHLFDNAAFLEMLRVQGSPALEALIPIVNNPTLIKTTLDSMESIIENPVPRLREIGGISQATPTGQADGVSAEVASPSKDGQGLLRKALLEAGEVTDMVRPKAITTPGASGQGVLSLRQALEMAQEGLGSDRKRHPEDPQR